MESFGYSNHCYYSFFFFLIFNQNFGRLGVSDKNILRDLNHELRLRILISKDEAEKHICMEAKGLSRREETGQSHRGSEYISTESFNLNIVCVELS